MSFNMNCTDVGQASCNCLELYSEYSEHMQVCAAGQRALGSAGKSCTMQRSYYSQPMAVSIMEGLNGLPHMYIWISITLS